MEGFELWWNYIREILKLFNEFSNSSKLRKAVSQPIPVNPVLPDSYVAFRTIGGQIVLLFRFWMGGWQIFLHVVLAFSSCCVRRWDMTSFSVEKCPPNLFAENSQMLKTDGNKCTHKKQQKKTHLTHQNYSRETTMADADGNISAPCGIILTNNTLIKR